ncbi:MAG: tetratricopeptide repeat protein [Candidatus Hodarchaeota archaeon]
MIKSEINNKFKMLYEGITDMLFDEPEQSLLQSYLIFLLKDRKKGRSLVGKFLKTPTNLNQNIGFVYGIAALITINESENIDSKAEEYLKHPKVSKVPIFRILTSYLRDGSTPSEIPEYLEKLAQKYLKHSHDFAERLQATNLLLIELSGKELDISLVLCPICQFNVPSLAIQADGGTICPKCGSSLVYDKAEVKLIPKPKIERQKGTISQPKTQDLSQLQEEAASSLEKAQLALAYLNQGRIKQAMDLMDSALQLQEEDPEILGAAAKFYFDLGELDKAIYCLEELESFDPEDIEVLGMLTNAYLQLDQKKEAIARLYRILELDPSNDYAKRLLEKLNEEERDFSEW